MTKTPPILYIMVGLPGSGKSTLSKALAKETKATILESDAIRKALYPHPTYTGRESGDVFRTILNGVRENGARGKTTIVDATNLTTRDRRPFYDTARAAGYHKFVTIFVQAPVLVCLDRLLHKDKGNKSDATGDVYQRMAEKDIGTFPYGVLLVDGTVDTQETLKEVMEAVQHWPILHS